MKRFEVSLEHLRLHGETLYTTFKEPVKAKTEEEAVELYKKRVTKEFNKKSKYINFTNGKVLRSAFIGFVISIKELPKEKKPKAKKPEFKINWRYLWGKK